MLKLDTIIMEEERAHKDANTIIQIKQTNKQTNPPPKKKKKKRTNKQTNNKQTDKQTKPRSSPAQTDTENWGEAHQVCRRVLVAGRVSLCCQLVYMRTTRHTDTSPADAEAPNWRTISVNRIRATPLLWRCNTTQPVTQIPKISHSQESVLHVLGSRARSGGSVKDMYRLWSSASPGVTFLTVLVSRSKVKTSKSVYSLSNLSTARLPCAR